MMPQSADMPPPSLPSSRLRSGPPAPRPRRAARLHPREPGKEEDGAGEVGERGGGGGMQWATFEMTAFIKPRVL